eukprot:CAMPEP_0174269118 /NCGR_PEP_ID=MMETSP0439-20130205/39947_1 /TAXON_ID=0 /ORGANISM="Stereomyxa ramosa, Strain Chinc5" /LENGTH=401 /DNA_ID=CAMNT_0015357715 /DNA_START=44 /DNA_END=1246 /DNA_ORIENTATION=-
MEEEACCGINDSVQFVTVREDQINTNNVVRKASYEFTRSDTGEKYERIKEAEKGKPQCDLCYQKFETFSKMFTHQARPCYEDGKLEPPYPNPITIAFDEHNLVYIGDVIEALQLPLKKEENGRVSVEVDETMFEITMRRFYTAQITKYNIEHWYPSLEELAKKNNYEKGYTSKTIFLKLSDEELKLLKGLASVTLSRNLGMGSRETQQELLGRELLEDRINNFMGNEGKEYFCRLSTRSPKDGVSTRIPDGEEDLVKCLNEKIQNLKVTNAEEVVNLLIKSQRIFSDISMFFQYRVVGSTSGEMCLILRDWIDDMPQDHEFRCYANNKNLSAISQYHCYYKFDRLQDKEHVTKIRDAIAKFHEEIKEAIPLPSYVFDVVVYPDYSCHLIELNPFGSDMSSG